MVDLPCVGGSLMIISFCFSDSPMPPDASSMVGNDDVVLSGVVPGGGEVAGHILLDRSTTIL